MCGVPGERTPFALPLVVVLVLVFWCGGAVEGDDPVLLLLLLLPCELAPSADDMFACFAHTGEDVESSVAVVFSELGIFVIRHWRSVHHNNNNNYRHSFHIWGDTNSARQ